MFFFFKQKAAYEMRISDWSSDVCSSDLEAIGGEVAQVLVAALERQIGIPDFERPADADKQCQILDLTFAPHHRGQDDAAAGVVRNVLGDAEGTAGRSEARRVGKKSVSSCKTRWLPLH